MDRYLQSLSGLLAEEKYLDMLRAIIVSVKRGHLTVNDYGYDECPFCNKIETEQKKGRHSRNCPVVLARKIDKEWVKRRELPPVVCELDNEPCIPDKEGFGRCGDAVKGCLWSGEKRG